MERTKNAILAQLARLADRKRSVRWLVGISSLPLFGVVAAFGIAPSTDTRDVAIHTVVESLALPPAAPQTRIDGSHFWHSEKIQRGDTIGSLLDRAGVNNADTLGLLRSVRGTASIRQLLPGRMVQVRIGAEGELLALRYSGNGETLLQVDRAEDGFVATEQPLPLETRSAMKSATIRHSLFGATDAAGIPDAIAMQLVDIFATEIDFHLDLRKDDRFSVVYETLHHNGDQVRTGRVLSAEFVNQGKTHRAIWFEDKEGRGGYYTPEGKNVRKAFLRSPLEFSRISSGFANARYHPVLKEWRAHRGVDYAAPTGTRVKATADGTVDFVGWQGGYGKVIVLRHQGTYSTVYGHLSGFAKNLRRGAKVSQGDVIAYVGATGLATGPHLHYEFKVAGVQRNPLTIALPTAFPIARKYRGDFETAAQPLLAQLDLLQGTNLAMLE